MKKTMKHPLINKKQNENPTNNPLTTKMQITKPLLIKNFQKKWQKTTISRRKQLKNQSPKTR